MARLVCSPASLAPRHSRRVFARCRNERIAEWEPGEPGTSRTMTRRIDFIRFCKPIVEQIRSTVAQPELMQPDEPDSDIMMANVELLAVLGSNIGNTKDDDIGRLIFPFPLPAPQEVERWKQEYLAVWDGYIDNLASGDYKSGRRRVLVATFDHLIAVCKAGPPVKE